MESLESFRKRCRADGIVLLQSRDTQSSFFLAFCLPSQIEFCVVTVFIRNCRAYELVCLAKGSSSADARAMLKYKDSPELYLDEFKASDQHFTSGLTHC